MLENLYRYNNISLEELNSLNIKKRRDTRYILTKEIALNLLENISTDYTLLKVDGDSVIGYETSYYDTKDFDLFNNHINKKDNRFNIRIRSYSTSKESFIDIKESKKRNKVSKLISPYKSEDKFKRIVETNTPYSFKNIEEKIAVHFNRFTFVNLRNREKITIDLDLGFTTLKSFESLSSIAIIEIKSERKFYNSSFKKLLKKKNVKPYTISKYCLGISLMYPNKNYLSSSFNNQYIDSINSKTVNAI